MQNRVTVRLPLAVPASESVSGVGHADGWPVPRSMIIDVPQVASAIWHGTRRIREKGRWPLPMVDSGALAASQPPAVRSEATEASHRAPALALGVSASSSQAPTNGSHLRLTPALG